MYFFATIATFSISAKDLRRVWQISHRVHSLRPFTSFDGGRVLGPNEGWRRFVEFVQEGRQFFRLC